MLVASVANSAGISMKAMIRPLTTPTASEAISPRAIAAAMPWPDWIATVVTTAPAAMEAICDRSMPRAMTTIAAPSASMPSWATLLSSVIMLP